MPSNASSPLQEPNFSGSIDMNSTPRTLRKIAYGFQLDANDIRAENNELKRKLADLENQQAGSKKKNSGATEETDEEQDRNELVKNLAHKSVLMCWLWLRMGAKTFSEQVDPEYSPLDRFDNTKGKVQGELSDLLELLPPQLQSAECMASSWLRRQFIEEMGVQRSNTAYRLRRQCGPSIFNCSAQDLALAIQRDKLFRERNGWLESAGSEGDGSGEYSTWDVALLHDDTYQGKFDRKSIFLNPILLRIFAALVRGPSAVEAMLAGLPVVAKGETMATKLGLTRTTAGAIAGCAVLARWVVSPDGTLQSKGLISSINYQKLFDTYLKYLLTGLDTKKATVNKIFQVWDQAIFPATADTGLGAGCAGSNAEQDEAEAEVFADLADDETVE
ncbi:hypothetical protein HWV62_34675 [Athelia sp. TMB]|nr:hypothetical protein HWV62_34675 [Athelia sp. TMB]